MLNNYSSSFINIEHQHNWHIIQSKYQIYLIICLRFISISIIAVYMQIFILPYIALLLILGQKILNHSQTLSKLAILKSREQIYTYIKFEHESVWYNAQYLHGYSFFNYNLMIISVKCNNKDYSYFILKYGMPKILFEDLRKMLHYLMFYSQIKKYTINN